MKEAANAEKKRISQTSRISNHGAMHMPETIWSAGQKSSAVECATMLVNSAAIHAAMQTIGSSIQRTTRLPSTLKINARTALKLTTKCWVGAGVTLIFDVASKSLAKMQTRFPSARRSRRRATC